MIYFQDYVVADPVTLPLREDQMLTEEEYRQAEEKYGEDQRSPTAEMGARRSSSSDDDQPDRRLSKKLRAELKATGAASRSRRTLIKRLKIIEASRDSENKSRVDGPRTAFPVIPPDCSPLVSARFG